MNYWVISVAMHTEDGDISASSHLFSTKEKAMKVLKQFYRQSKKDNSFDDGFWFDDNTGYQMNGLNTERAELSECVVDVI